MWGAVFAHLSFEQNVQGVADLLAGSEPVNDLPCGGCAYRNLAAAHKPRRIGIIGNGAPAIPGLWFEKVRTETIETPGYGDLDMFILRP